MSFLIDAREKLLVTVDGPDGVGKSVFISKLQAAILHYVSKCARELLAADSIENNWQVKYVSPFGRNVEWDLGGGSAPRAGRRALKAYIDAVKTGKFSWNNEDSDEELTTHLFFLANADALRYAKSYKATAYYQKSVFLFDRSFVSFQVEQDIYVKDYIDKYDYNIILIDDPEAIFNRLEGRAKKDAFDPTTVDAVEEQEGK